MGLHDGRVVIVTGAAGGIGREHALEFARQGASVVVNDVGPVDDVLTEIKELGGQAVGNDDDVSDWEGAGRLVQTALDTFGDLHVLVNNAGILRDKMFVNMDVSMWDDVMRVHLRGTFCPTRHAVDHWRAQHKAGTPVAHPRIINTSSPSGLYGNVGQSNYGAAKAAIASFTVILADELERLGVTVNAIAPSALTQMTEGLDEYVRKMAEIKERTGFDAGSPANIAPIVVWLASAEAQAVTGRVFNVKAGKISVAQTWVTGPPVEKEERWDPAELGDVIPLMVAQARPNSDGSGSPAELDVTATDGISVERDGQVATVWLDRPERGNGFISAMQVELHRQLEALDADAEVRAVVVTGRGRFFSTGADLEPGGANFAFDEEQTKLARKMMADRPRPWKMRTPIIAAMNGSAVGLGLTFPLQWDIRIVNESAKYGFVFTRRGLIPEQNSLWLLPRLVGLSTALELLITGRLFSGTEAKEMGIATRAVPAEEVLPTALALSREIATQTAPSAVAVTKQLAYEMLAEPDREAAFHREWELFRWMGRQPDSAEGVASFVEKRPPQFPCSKDVQVPRTGPLWAALDD